ncbi:hypothetical protein DPV78_011640 [Talaromyces pinophilus]|nr:hypothetical protein DPV78_011640 [Talaromyces pinophilus]
MATPMLNQFLAGVADLVSKRQGDNLQDYLQVVPEQMRDGYRHMAVELQQAYPKGPGDDALLKRCEALVPKSADGTTWPAFPLFIRSYLAYLRDGNVSNLLEAYKALSGLLNQCLQALGDTQMGAIVLRTVVYLSQIVAGLAMTLEKNPQLLAQLRLDRPQDAFERTSLVEDAANVVREGFIKCLSDRGGAAGPKGKPEGKRAGIYLMANHCLKLLHKCGKLRSADTIFKSISAQSPPLEYYPAAHRVTYLYYLGRYLFANNSFYLARNALQEAYNQCHVQCLKQKRLILTYLISCNIVMGRFPSLQLLQKPEAQGLYDIFYPVCLIIRSGDYLAFRKHMNVGSSTGQWFLQKGLLYQMRNRCELLVWRSLIRKVFILGGFHGDPSAARGPPPILHLSKVEIAVRMLQNRHGVSSSSDVSATKPSGTNVITIRLPDDSDYDGIAGLVLNTSDPAIDDYLFSQGYYDENGELIQNPGGQLVPGPEYEQYADSLDDLYPEIYGRYTETENSSKLLQEIESIVASLIKQNLLGGYLTHNPARFVIPGAKHVGAMAKGFPNIWQTISSQQHNYGEDVPAWVVAKQPLPTQAVFPAVGAPGGGRVINLKGAKAVGS